MAGLGYTDYDASVEIDGNVYLEAMAFSYGTYNDEAGTTAFQKWDSNNLTYTMHENAANPDGTTVGTWSTELTDAIDMAMADISAICELTFTEVSSDADIDYYYYDENDGYAGYSYGIGGAGVYLNQDAVYGDDEPTDNGLAYGGFNYRTVIHEILHNVGVAHPHDSYAVFPGVDDPGDTGDNALSQNLYTVMSYNRVQQVDDNGDRTTGWDWTADSVDQSFGVMGAFDIAIMQALYGANMTTATGDDVYLLPEVNQEGTYYQCVWDAGGEDEFRYNGSGDAAIDLRAATLDEADGMLAGGVLSSADGVYGGYTIAQGVEIENATSGNGNDLLVGNDANNVLDGRGGDDVAQGGDGFDTLKGRGGSDDLDGGNRADKIYGNGGQDTLRGGFGIDTIKGGGSRDEIFGDGGADKLTGGAGRDTFWFDKTDGTDVIYDFTDDVDTLGLLGPGDDFSDVTVEADVNGDAMISYGNTTVTLLGVLASQITEDDFMFV